MIEIIHGWSYLTQNVRECAFLKHPLDHRGLGKR